MGYVFTKARRQQVLYKLHIIMYEYKNNNSENIKICRLWV